MEYDNTEYMNLGTVMVANVTRDLVHDSSHTKDTRRALVEFPSYENHRNTQITQKHADSKETNGWRSMDSVSTSASMTVEMENF